MNRGRPGDSKVTEDGAKSDLSKTDTGQPDGPLGDGPVADQTADITVTDGQPDQVGPTGIVLVQGGFGTGGPGSGGGMVLVEGGFEMGETLCNSTANICVTGGIVP